jgi:hypothetical protein
MPCVGEGVSVSDLMMEGYFARSCLTGSRMALLTSCRGVSAASESEAVLLQETFRTSHVGVAGAVSAVEADLGEGSFLPLASVLPPWRLTEPTKLLHHNKQND